MCTCSRLSNRLTHSQFRLPPEHLHQPTDAVDADALQKDFARPWLAEAERVADGLGLISRGTFGSTKSTSEAKGCTLSDVPITMRKHLRQVEQRALAQPLRQRLAEEGDARLREPAVRFVERAPAAEASSLP